MKFHLLNKTHSRGIHYVTFCTPYNPMKDPMVHEHIVYQAYRSPGEDWEMFILCYEDNFEYRAQPISLIPEVISWLDQQ